MEAASQTFAGQSPDRLQPPPANRSQDLFLAEGWLVFLNQGDDKNFFLSLVPLSLFLFNWVSRTNLFRDRQWQHLKRYSVSCFFFHPIFIELGFLIANQTSLKVWEKGLWIGSVTFLAIHLLALLVYENASNEKKSGRWKLEGHASRPPARIGLKQQKQYHRSQKRNPHRQAQDRRQQVPTYALKIKLKKGVSYENTETVYHSRPAGAWFSGCASRSGWQ